MSTPLVVAIVAVAILSVVILLVAVLFLITQVRTLTASLKQLRSSLEPTLNDLTAEAEAAQRRLERVSAETAKITPPGALD